MTTHTKNTIWLCKHKDRRDEYTPVTAPKGQEIGRLCLECGNTAETYFAAKKRAYNILLTRKMLRDLDKVLG